MKRVCFITGHNYEDLLHVAVQRGEFVKYEELIHYHFLVFQPLV
jgi:hypothetical protein